MPPSASCATASSTRCSRRARCPSTARRPSARFRIEVVEPIRTIRYVVEPNEHGIECDLTFRATTVAVEEPRQRTTSPEGILTMDHTRLTQWGTWEGTISVDGDELRIDPSEVPGHARPVVGHAAGRSAARDKLGSPRPAGLLAVGAVALRRPLHPLGTPRVSGRHALARDLAGARPAPRRRGTMEHRRGDGSATTSATSSSSSPDAARSSAPTSGSSTPTRARCTSSSKRCSPSACAASATAIRTGATAPTTVTWRPAESRSSSTTSTRSTVHSFHLQNLVIARMGDRTGVGVLEEAHFGPHTPSGLTGFIDGFGG